MYDDYEIEESFITNDPYAQDIEELEYSTKIIVDYNNMEDTYDLDESYARDSCDYSELAYRHYA